MWTNRAEEPGPSTTVRLAPPARKGSNSAIRSDFADGGADAALILAVQVAVIVHH